MAQPKRFEIRLTIFLEGDQALCTGDVAVQTAEYLRSRVAPMLDQGFRCCTDDNASWDLTVSPV
jgi:hypothetical protein